MGTFTKKRIYFKVDLNDAIKMHNYLTIYVICTILAIHVFFFLLKVHNKGFFSNKGLLGVKLSVNFE